LADLIGPGGVHEALIVSTCNRTELYCVVPAHSPVDPASWLTRWHQQANLHEHLYRFEGDAAVQHAFEVASGLDSMVIGEPQILGQLKDAYRTAQDCGTAGALLNRLFQSTFSVAKRVRTETHIGANAVSVASAAVGLARQIFSNLERHTALLVGAGETIALTARHLRAHGLHNMIIANRTLSRAEALAAEFNASAITLDALPHHLAQADIVISSTASPVPVITLKDTQAALVARKRKPIFMVDIAVPRDIEPEIGQLEDVYLYSLDDLQQSISDNLQARHGAADQARLLIAEEVQRFHISLRGQDAVPAIRALRAAAEVRRLQTLDQARRLMASGKTPEEALEYLASTLTSRLIHVPTQTLREAGEHGDAALVEAARRLFGLIRS
jgi:glutamyl-tRNA reductase